MGRREVCFYVMCEVIFCLIVLDLGRRLKS